MDDLSRSINDYIAASEAARHRLQSKFTYRIESTHIQSALMRRKSLSHSVDLMRFSWMADSIVSELKNERFEEAASQKLFSISLSKSIIPPGSTLLITEKRVTVNNEIWEIHKNDVDPFPSNPHAHNYEANLKLHLGNGQLYRKRQYRGKIKKKDLIRIREELTAASITLPPFIE